MKYFVRLLILLLGTSFSISSNADVLKEIDFSSHKSASKFKTRLSSAIGKPANFARKYVVVNFGCGSNCYSFVLIDTTNGKVHFGRYASLGFVISLNSNTLIVNPLASLVEFYGSEANATKQGNLFSTNRYEWHEQSASFRELSEN